MSTQNALPLPGPLISQIEAVAEAEQVTPEQLLQNLLAKHLDDKGWQTLIEGGNRNRADWDLLRVMSSASFTNTGKKNASVDAKTRYG